MPGFSERMNLSSGLKQTPILELIENAKLSLESKQLSRRAMSHYNLRFNDLQQSSFFFNTERLTEKFISQYVEDGRQWSRWLAFSSVQRKSILNFIAESVNAPPVFAYKNCADKIVEKCHWDSLNAYVQHLNGQGKSKDTIKSYLQTATKFLLHFEKKCGCELSKISAVDIRDFFTGLGASWSPRSIQITPSHLNNYLKYAGISDITTLLPSLRTPRKSKPVRAMARENVEALWRYVENDCGDYRAKAILAILLSTGMRPVDVTKLKLSDINWNNDSISFIQSKTGVGMNISLFPAVGSAIAKYMIKQRPVDTGLKSIFLTKKAPYREIISSICNHVIKDAFKATGITYVPDGLHCPRAVRRSLVSQMIAKGIPIQKAAASIGHIGENSVDLYTELDVNKMRSICLPIPTPMKGWCV